MVFFQLYNVFFIFALIIKFISEKPRINIKDNLLGKKVPSIVFIQNQKLITDAFKEGLERDEIKMNEIRARAQINEHIYMMLKESGISMKVDEDIGMQFVEVTQITQRASLVSTDISYLTYEMNTTNLLDHSELP